MNRLRYCVATSLDGYIAGPSGENDWMMMDPEFDFGEFLGEFDTVLLGRRTYEEALRHGTTGTVPGMWSFVFSRTLMQKDHLETMIVSDDVIETVRDAKARSRLDVWLMGGGGLFRSLLDAGLVDSVEVAVIPILLSEGVPLLAPGARSGPLRLTECRPLPSGIVMLSYAIDNSNTE